MAAVPAALLSGCGPRLPGSHKRHLRSLKIENAIADAREASERGDRRLLGIQGMGTFVPGPYSYEDAALKFGITPIPGTSDMLINDEHAALQDNARHYAAAYNAEMARLHP